MSKLFTLISRMVVTPLCVLSLSFATPVVTAYAGQPIQDHAQKKRKLPPGARGFESYTGRRASDKLIISEATRGGLNFQSEEAFVRGRDQFDAGKYREAVASFKQAIAASPDWPIPHYALGVAYETLGQYTEAIESYQKTISFKPYFVFTILAYYNMANALAALGQYEAAIAAYRETMRLVMRHLNTNNPISKLDFIHYVA